MERARKLFIVPTELSQAFVESLDVSCQEDLTKGGDPPYALGVAGYVLQKPVTELSAAARYRILQCLGLANGIKLVFVSLAGDEAILEVQFFNRNYLKKIVDKYDAEKAADPTIARRIFSISGGHRVPAGAASGQVQVQAIELPADFDARQLTTLKLTVKPIGDYSTYKLSLNTSVFPSSDAVIIDPVFNEIDFKFRPGCFNINCAPDWGAAPEPLEEPVIDYLAKDYESFRHTMIAAMMQRVPGWQASSEADLDQVLLELFSAAADELSDYQDRVMNEAYLSTARKRVSLARHARLMDYHIHQGNQASTWLALEVALALPSEPQAGATRQYFLADNFKVWAGGETENSSSVVFLTRGRMRVHPLVNRMGLYTWSDAIPSLMAGDTTADLRLFLNEVTPATDEDSARAVESLIRTGVVKHLLIQEHLNPATGTVNGFNPQKRQLLHLLPGDEGAEAMLDPMTAEWFVRVRWSEKDKLKTNYCFTVDCGAPAGKVENVSLFHGNLIEASHGSRQLTFFKEPEALLNNSLEFHFERSERWGTLCTLPARAVAYRNTLPGGDVPPETTLSVVVSQPGGGTDFWDEVPNLIHSDDSDENGDHFMVETDEEGTSRIRFGNGKNGKALPQGAIVGCAYQVGVGTDGNIGLGTLTNFDAATNSLLKLEANILAPAVDGSIIQRCWNPFDVTNGRAPEPAAEIIRRAPEAYRERQLRAVTLEDYIRRAQELPEVSRAAARYAWTGSWRTVQVTIDPVGTFVLEEELRRKIERHLNAVRLIGEDLEIRPPRFVPLEIYVSLCARPDFWPEDLRAILEQEFSDGWTPDGRMGFFHPDLWTFGQQLRASQIIGRVLSVEGVEHIISLSMKRWNDPAQATGEAVVLNFNEIVQVLGDPDHMEKGFISFEVKGGRQ